MKLRKRVFMFGLYNTPAVQGRTERFLPDYAEVSDYGDRASVKVQTSRRHPFPTSVSFVLYDAVGRYEKPEKRICPDWLVPLIREAGYTGEIQGHADSAAP